MTRRSIVTVALLAAVVAPEAERATVGTHLSRPAILAVTDAGHRVASSAVLAWTFGLAVIAMSSDWARIIASGIANLNQSAQSALDYLQGPCVA